MLILQPFCGLSNLLLSILIHFYFRTYRYTLVIRYKQERSQAIELNADFHYNNNSVSVLFKSVNFTLPATAVSVSSSYHHPTVTELLGNGNYSVTLSFANASVANLSVDIDSIVLLWDITPTRYYQSANETIKNVTRACWERRRGVVMNSAESDACKKIAFSVNSELFNGSLGTFPIQLQFRILCKSFDLRIFTREIILFILGRATKDSNEG